MATPAGTVDSAISSASGLASPPRATSGRPAAASAAVSAATPCGQAFRPPRSLSTTRSARAASPVTSSAAILAGLAVR